MSIEKQLQKKDYRNIMVVDIKNDAEFNAFKKHLDEDTSTLFLHMKFNLFILKAKEKKVYYVYDHFRSVKKLDDLCTIKEKDEALLNRILEAPGKLECIYCIEGQAYIIGVTADDKNAFINQYGYPHNYRSSIHFESAYGKLIGAILGGLLGAAIFGFFVYPLVLSAIIGVPLLLAAVFALVGVPVIAGIGGVIGAIPMGILGSIVGGLIGVLDHYCEKHLVNSLDQQQVANESEYHLSHSIPSPQTQNSPTSSVNASEAGFHSVLSKANPVSAHQDDELDARTFFKYCLGGG